MKKSFISTPYLLWIVIFNIVPLGMLLYYGLSVPSPNGVTFSMNNITKVVEPIYIKAMWRSIKLAGISTIICLILAYPLALIFAKKSTSTSTMIFVFILPMWMNFLLRTYAWISILEINNGLLNTVLRFINLPTLNIMSTSYAIVLGMVYNFLPFMILPIYNTLIKIDVSLLEAASDLGANSLVAFLKVTLPLSIPGVISGISMVFMPAVTSFVIPNLLGGGKINLIGNMIENQFLANYDWHFGSSLSLILMVIILITMAVLSRFENDDKEVSLC
ncbi:ABC transporter permease [Vallitalea sp.]|jgi:spermidine/putrescine transport system permease protein|uniref:ABC transporter permease n=1 Tax=Vallitalea sp. TaxID=1882829 RepID=UPI0025F5BA6F|nr:ABC transporter permease [Vallitalea sp.]MCT4688533.1 ABC transporter permease [Vallitalea sp.]